MNSTNRKVRENIIKVLESPINSIKEIPIEKLREIHKLLKVENNNNMLKKALLGRQRNPKKAQNNSNAIAYINSRIKDYDGTSNRKKVEKVRQENLKTTNLNNKNSSKVKQTMSNRFKGFSSGIKGLASGISRQIGRTTSSASNMIYKEKLNSDADSKMIGYDNRLKLMETIKKQSKSDENIEGSEKIKQNINKIKTNISVIEKRNDLQKNFNSINNSISINSCHYDNISKEYVSINNFNADITKNVEKILEDIKKYKTLESKNIKLNKSLIEELNIIYHKKSHLNSNGKYYREVKKITSQSVIDARVYNNEEKLKKAKSYAKNYRNQIYLNLEKILLLKKDIINRVSYIKKLYKVEGKKIIDNYLDTVIIDYNQAQTEINETIKKYKTVIIDDPKEVEIPSEEIKFLKNMQTECKEPKNNKKNIIVQNQTQLGFFSKLTGSQPKTKNPKQTNTTTTATLPQTQSSNAVNGLKRVTLKNDATKLYYIVDTVQSDKETFYKLKYKTTTDESLGELIELNRLYKSNDISLADEINVGDIVVFKTDKDQYSNPEMHHKVMTIKGGLVTLEGEPNSYYQKEKLYKVLSTQTPTKKYKFLWGSS